MQSPYCHHHGGATLIYPYFTQPSPYDTPLPQCLTSLHDVYRCLPKAVALAKVDCTDQYRQIYREGLRGHDMYARQYGRDFFSQKRRDMSAWQTMCGYIVPFLRKKSPTYCCAPTGVNELSVFETVFFLIRLYSQWCLLSTWYGCMADHGYDVKKMAVRVGYQ